MNGPAQQSLRSHLSVLPREGVFFTTNSNKYWVTISMPDAGIASSKIREAV